MSEDFRDDPDGPALPNDIEESTPSGEVSRRSFLRWSALAGAGASMAGALARSAAADPGSFPVPAREIEELTIAEMVEGMERGGLSSVDLVNQYLERIQALDVRGPAVNSVIQINPQAKAIAKARDKERKAGNVRGPLHGIPILLKDNIDTGDKMMTTAGSFALLGAPAPQDATVTARLRAAGAVILGKANLSEWANFRGFNSSSGWSGVGGQTRNPYVLDRNPCGSSSGSGAAVSANLTAAALATETDGSIVCPASLCGIVGIKPTVGLTSRAGVVPISHSQDTVGPHGRRVADAAAVLGALVGVDPRDPATAASAGKFHTDYTQFLDTNGLHGARIGVLRNGVTGYSRATDEIFEHALEVMADAGAELVDPADIPTMDQLLTDPAELIVLVREFKTDLNAYLATRTGVPVHTMADVIAFNLAHFEQELKWFGQEWFELSQDEIFSEQEYVDALARQHSLSREQGIDAVLHDHNLDALVAPTGSPAWPTDLVNGDHFLGASSFPAAMAGYPMVQLNAGFAFGVLPVGISFIGTAYSEPTLIKIASGFEHVIDARRAPQFIPTMALPTGDSGFAPATAGSSVRLQRLKALASAGATLRGIRPRFS
jgi:amidase